MQNTILSTELEYYARNGAFLAPIPCGAKNPLGIVANVFLDCSNDPAQWQRWRDAHTNCNFVLVAEKSRLIMLDIDVKEIGRDRAIELYRNWFESRGLEILRPHVRTPSGGFHCYVRMPDDVDPIDLTAAQLVPKCEGAEKAIVETKLGKGLTNAAGSYFNGQRPDGGLDPAGHYTLISNDPPHVCPPELIEFLRKKDAVPKDTAAPETTREIEELLPTLPAHIVRKLNCEDATGDRSADIAKCAKALIGHGCSDEDIFQLIWNHALGAKAREKKDNGKWLRDDIARCRGKGFGVQKPAAVMFAGAKTGDIVGEPKWKDLCIQDDKGRIIPNVYNATIAIKAWLGQHLGFDEMVQSYVWRHDGREIVENDVIDIQRGLQFDGFTRIGKDIVNDAINNVAIKNRFCPLLEYLNGLKWDGMPRVGQWLSAYLGAERTPYTDAIGQMSLVAMVARAYEPGCQADYMLVLEGEQGIFKSSLCRALVGDKWFAQDLPRDLNSKDTMQFLRGKWLIEAGEMYFATKADSALLKAFITRRVEKYRPPFERRDVSEPRRCLFIGTTNKAQYLRDETGARRFWPVKCKFAAIDRLKADRDQLFAEAVHLYRSGARWWPDHDFEAEHIAPEQKARQETDAWEDEIAKWLASKTNVTVLEVATGALSLHKAAVGRVEQNRITSILEGLGWGRAKPVHGRKPWVRAQELPSAA